MSNVKDAARASGWDTVNERKYVSPADKPHALKQSAAGSPGRAARRDNSIADFFDALTVLVKKLTEHVDEAFKQV